MGESDQIKIQDLIGKNYDNPDWERILNQLSADELINLFNKGAFQTIDLLSIGKPKTIEADGPNGFVNFMSNPLTGAVYGTSHYASSPIMAATFNKDLLYAYGEAVGEEGLIGDERGDGTPYSGWYAPGINIHHSYLFNITGPSYRLKDKLELNQTEES